jgi:hypothetical protein
MCLSETHNKIYVVKHFDSLPIQNDQIQGNALRPLHFNFPSEHDIKSVQQNQEEMELSTTHQLLVDTYDAN